jgi:hypothetical protein
MASMHEIEYKVFGDDMQFVEVDLDPNEATVAEAGGMMYMDDGIDMETIFGDGSQPAGGFLGALMGAGKRLLTGESLFMTVFLNRSSQKRRIAFGAPYPGKIIPVHLAEIGGELIAQKDSFLAAAKGVSVGIAFQRRTRRGRDHSRRHGMYCRVPTEHPVRHRIRWQDQVGTLRRRRPLLCDTSGPWPGLAAVIATQPSGEPDYRCRAGPRARRAGRRFAARWTGRVPGRG